ncbi:MAG: metallophosphoesterase [Clostridia bacterium]|nr:metallophosphoesterase [Clostridia bacterium]
MALFYIADLHLSENDPGKKMDVFGGRWRGYTKKIMKNWTEAVAPGDTVVIGGDISWGMNLTEAYPDLLLINGLSGRKIVLEGNHDFYWQSLKKMNAFCEQNGFEFEFLRNNAYRCGDIAICGSRGWYTDEREIPETLADNTVMIPRECGRLRTSLEAGAALGGEPVVFMHFPPVFGAYKCEEFIDVMLGYGVRRCYSGHIHGKYDVPPKVNYRGIDFYFGAADYLHFKPLLV